MGHRTRYMESGTQDPENGKRNTEDGTEMGHERGDTSYGTLAYGTWSTEHGAWDTGRGIWDMKWGAWDIYQTSLRYVARQGGWVMGYGA